MRITLNHQTRYVYEAPSSYSIQTLKMTPASFTGQTIHSWVIDVPGIERASKFRDACGNLVHLVDQPGEHSELVISVRGDVETADMSGVVRGLAEQAPPRVFLRFTRQTEADEAIRDLAEKSQGKERLSRLHDLSSLVRNALEYRTGSTAAHTTGAEALSAGEGVCQDHAHIFIAAARHLMIPARYITGYLVTDDQADAHHAWAEAYVEKLGWVGFDVANRICPTENYVRLAAGLDAAHAAPVKGSRRGGGAERLDVRVQVEQASNQ